MTNTRVIYIKTRDKNIYECIKLCARKTHSRTRSRAKCGFWLLSNGRLGRPSLLSYILRARRASSPLFARFISSSPVGRRFRLINFASLLWYRGFAFGCGRGMHCKFREKRASRHINKGFSSARPPRIITGGGCISQSSGSLFGFA